MYTSSYTMYSSRVHSGVPLVNFVQDRRKDPEPSRSAFVLAVMILTPRGASSKAKPSAIFPRQLRPRLPLHLVSLDRTKVRD